MTLSGVSHSCRSRLPFPPRFVAALFLIDDREDYGKARIRAMGFLDARLHVLVFTANDEELRAISLRKATKHEAKSYKEDR